MQLVLAEVDFDEWICAAILRTREISTYFNISICLKWHAILLFCANELCDEKN